MNRSPEERLTRDVAREICQRQGVKALLVGSIASLGSNYVLSLEALNAQSGDAFAREQTEVSKKEEVLKALGTISSKLREKLGESLASIQKFDAPIEQATTSSLEALKALSLGDEKRAAAKYEESIPFYKRATDIDPNFAVAYARLAVMHFTVRETEKAAQYAEKAFTLRDRVSEREKFYISSTYYQTVSGDIEKYIETLQLWNQTYPRDSIPPNNLAVGFASLGDFEKGLAAARESMKLNPNISPPYANLVHSYLRLNRFDEAEQVMQQATAQDKVSTGLHGSMYLLAYLRRDAKGMKQQVDWATGKPFEALSLRWQAAASSNSGRLAEAGEFRKKAIDLASGRDQKEFAAQIHLDTALTESAIGNCAAANQAANAALVLQKGKQQLSLAAFAFALCKDGVRAESIMHDLANRFPNDTQINAVSLPLVRALAELNRNNPEKAIQLLESVRRYELGALAVLWPNYVRGLAYLKLGRSREAVTEFQRILEHQPITFFSVIHPLSQLQLARAWTLAARDGEPTAKESALSSARKAYQDFLAAWKDAEANNPVLQQAKAEYAKLN